MEYLLFFIFVIINLVLTYLGISRKNFVLNIISGMIFLFLGTILISEGLAITHTGSYGFLLNNTSAITGIASSTTTVKDVWISGFGFFFWMLGIYLIITILLPSKTEPEDKKRGS
jgi:hypothetical protein